MYLSIVPVALTFFTVQDFSSVFLLHLLGTQALVGDITLDLQVALTVVRNGFQKGTGTATWPGKDETHLTRTEETGKVGQEVTGFGRHGVDPENFEELDHGHDELLHDSIGESSDVDLCLSR